MVLITYVFRNVQKLAKSFVMSVRPHGTTRFPLDGFSRNSIFDYFPKICPQHSCQNEKHFGHNLWTKQDTFFDQYYIIFFRKCALYKKMRKNTEEPHMPQMTIWRMSIACWITKATNTHSENVILVALPLQQWLHVRASMLRYTCIACLSFCAWNE